MTPNTNSQPNSSIESQGPTWLAVELFQNRQLYRLKPNCHGGLILQKRFYTELICPGSALGGTIDTAITGVFAFGSAQLTVPNEPIERQQAFQTRLNQSNYLQHLMQEQSKFNRACLLFKHLQKLVGATEIYSIPPELLGQLIGLTPKRIAAVRSSLSSKQFDRHEQECRV